MTLEGRRNRTIQAPAALVRTTAEAGARHALESRGGLAPLILAPAPPPAQEAASGRNVVFNQALRLLERLVALRPRPAGKWVRLDEEERLLWRLQAPSRRRFAMAVDWSLRVVPAGPEACEVSLCFRVRPQSVLVQTTAGERLEAGAAREAERALDALAVHCETAHGAAGP